MSRVVWPVPPLDYDPNFLPEARWWRLPLVDVDEHGYIYYLTKDGEKEDHSDCTYTEMRFNDGYNTILDGGMDTPNVALMCLSYKAPLIEYLDLLMVDQPTPDNRWRALTEPGERTHPECPGLTAEVERTKL